MNFDCHALDNKFETEQSGVNVYRPYDQTPVLLHSNTVKLKAELHQDKVQRANYHSHLFSVLYFITLYRVYIET